MLLLNAKLTNHKPSYYNINLKPTTRINIMPMSEKAAATDRATVEQVGQAYSDMVGNLFAASRARKEAKARAEADRYQQIESRRLVDSNNILRGNVKTVSESRGQALYAAQAAINVLMRELNIDFESAKTMVFKELDNANYKEKLMDASMNDNPELFTSAGLTSGARAIIDKQ